MLQDILEGPPQWRRTGAGTIPYGGNTPKLGKIFTTPTGEGGCAFRSFMNQPRRMPSPTGTNAARLKRSWRKAMTL